MFEKVTVFEGRSDGYHNCRIPTLVTAPGGTILATCEARKGGGGDYDESDLLLRRSTDGGRTWQSPIQLLDHASFGAGNTNNCVLTVDTVARCVHALICFSYNRVFYRCSHDDGATWSPQREITEVFNALQPRYPWNVVATGPGHGTQLRNGRLIVPVWLATHRSHRPSCVTTVTSDDHGQTWQVGDIAIPESILKNPSETLCVELADGRVMLNARNEDPAHRRAITISPDGATGWSPPVFQDDLPDPICMASLIRYRWPVQGEPGILLFVNPASVAVATDEASKRARKRLAVKLSYDDGATWPVERIIDPGPSGYSDLAIAADGTILCLYECGSLDHMYDTRVLAVARFDLAWILGD